jgi:hypothetical protein
MALRQFLRAISSSKIDRYLVLWRSTAFDVLLQLDVVMKVAMKLCRRLASRLAIQVANVPRLPDAEIHRGVAVKSAGRC